MSMKHNMPKFVWGRDYSLTTENEEFADDFLVHMEFPRATVFVGNENIDMPKIGFTNIQYEILWIEPCSELELAKFKMELEKAIALFDEITMSGY